MKDGEANIDKRDYITLHELLQQENNTKSEITIPQETDEFANIIGNHRLLYNIACIIEPSTHIKNLMRLCKIFASVYDLRVGQIEDLLASCVAHDVGKVAIPKYIIYKPLQLDDHERELVKTHCVEGYKLLSNTKVSDEIQHITLQHHEKWDETGYPLGLFGDNISLLCRIFTIIDVYEALTSDRAYKRAWEKDDAVDFILDGSGSIFDPNLVNFVTEL